MQIRNAQSEDDQQISSLLEAAFRGPGEAQLVRSLRQANQLPISLVAETNQHIVGYVGFSPAEIHSSTLQHGLALAPLAVAESYRKQGIGAQLTHAGIKQAHTQGIAWIVVLGDPRYYGRFGFTPASTYGLTHDYGNGPVQILLLDAKMAPSAGHIGYATAFRDLDE